MILVTGGTGFIGAHLLYHLVSRGGPVKALKRASSSTFLTEWIFSLYADDPRPLLEQIHWVTGDLLDYTSLVDALKGVSQLYHCAAVVSFHAENREEVIQVNVEGTANLVNAALDNGVKGVCFVSSIGALGRNVSHEVVNEESRFVPSAKNSSYSTSKYEAEREVWRGHAEGLDVVVVNPSIVVGPGDWSRGSPQLFQTMWNGLRYYSAGTNGFIDVHDVARIMIHLTEGDHSGEQFILSTENVSYQQFFTWMAEAMDIPPPRIKAGPVLSSIGWRMLKLRGLVTGRRSAITRETARTANQEYRYSNAKLTEAVPFRLTPVKESVERTAAIFLNDIRKSKVVS